MARLFGFSVEDNEKKSPSIVSPVPENNQDGSDFYIQSGFYVSYVDKDNFSVVARFFYDNKKQKVDLMSERKLYGVHV